METFTNKETLGSNEGKNLSQSVLTNTVQGLLSKNQVALGSLIRSINVSDYELKKRFPSEVTDNDVIRIDNFIQSVGDYVIKTNPITEENFKVFLVGYMKLHVFDYRAIITGMKLLKGEFEKTYGKKNSTVSSLSLLVTNNKKIINEVLNEVLKPGKAREGLYSLVGINRERAGIDNKLGLNGSSQIFMKGLIDEIMSIGPVAEYLINEPWECVKGFMGILRPPEEFERTLKDVVQSYSKMFKVDSNTPQGMYEVGKGSTQWFMTLLPAGQLKSLLVKGALRASKLIGNGPGLRFDVEKL